MIGTENNVFREQMLDILDYVKLKKATPFSSTDRIVKHVTELANSLENN